MEQLPIEANARSRERLAGTVASLSQAQLETVVDGQLTVAVVLAQAAFWDRWARQLLHRWRSGQLPPPSVPDWYDEAINDALLPIWQAIPAAASGAVALAAADAVDHEVSRVETPVLAALTASGQSHLLHRHRYREAALDRVDRALA